MDLRQLPAACFRSAPVNWMLTNFSASAKVWAKTSGPTSDAVPKAGGAPGGGAVAGSVGFMDSVAFCVFSFPLQEATAAPNNPVVVRVRNCLRVFDMSSPRQIIPGKIVCAPFDFRSSLPTESGTEHKRHKKPEARSQKGSFPSSGFWLLASGFLCLLCSAPHLLCKAAARPHGMIYYAH